MRRQLLDFLAAHPQGVTTQGTALHKIVLQALRMHRDRLMPGGAGAS